MTYIPGLRQTLYSALVLQLHYNPQSSPSELGEKIYKNKIHMTVQPSAYSTLE